ncbi:uncharacterized protein BYT42DRAFT_300742 [Radiomyces spectabilis]|uniref:uncharacterized protein n=1 Tax=Radiomyces spectabilis TaxID=64574 RepID=UPI0022201B62|nr:uncharacterized protein BYT42DRAFT_300742 [Radiomyces spectabilis]KAI8381305.1 hypothetical protein BYT42DRAFT_300742 [Radiomyces spectabilis]
MKEMKNRHPNRKCKHILVSILYVLCRKHNDPRTFAEICTAANVRKQEIGAYYRLVLKLLKTSTVGLRTVNIEECLQRWCSTMELPPLILPAAICVSRRAAELNLTQGKCAISLGAASIYLCCQTWSHVRIQKNCPINPLYDIWQSHKEIAMTAGVVTATLIGCYRLLRPHVHTLLPDWFLVAAASDLSQDPATRPVSK